MLRAVCFDFGDTLVSTRLDWGRIHPAMLDGLQAALEPHLPQVDYRRLRRDFLFLRRMGKIRAEQTLVEAPATDSLARALMLQHVGPVPAAVLQQGVDGFFAPEEAEYSLVAGIPEALARLRVMGVKLAVISNATCGALIRRALMRRMLLPFLAEVVVSAEHGRCKPEPSIFRSALSRLEVAPGQAAMVGDRLPTDIAGARAAGMRAVLVDFLGDGGHVPADAIRPDAVVRSPEEMLRVLKAWMA